MLFALKQTESPFKANNKPVLLWWWARSVWRWARTAPVSRRARRPIPARTVAAVVWNRRNIPAITRISIIFVFVVAKFAFIKTTHVSPPSKQITACFLQKKSASPSAYGQKKRAEPKGRACTRQRLRESGEFKAGQARKPCHDVG